MSQYAYFYNSKNGDRVYDADSFSDWLYPFFTTGVFNNDLQVTANNNMTITVQIGYCNIKGKVKKFTTPETLTVEAANGSLARKANLVLRRNDSGRDIYPTIRYGNFSANPTAPPLVREGDIYEIKLAEIYIPPAALKITQENITDCRMDKNVCGWVMATIKEIDFNQITAQFDSFFTLYTQKTKNELEAIKTELDTFKTNQETAFTSWINSIKDILDENAAGHLQLTKIDKDKNAVEMSDLSQEVKEAMTGGAVAVVGNKSVGYNQTTFLERSFANISKTGQKRDDIKISNGGPVGDSNFSCYVHIPVKPMTKYIIKNVRFGVSEYSKKNEDRVDGSYYQPIKFTGLEYTSKQSIELITTDTTQFIAVSAAKSEITEVIVHEKEHGVLTPEIELKECIERVAEAKVLSDPILKGSKFISIWSGCATAISNPVTVPNEAILNGKTCILLVNGFVAKAESETFTDAADLADITELVGVNMTANWNNGVGYYPTGVENEFGTSVYMYNGYRGMSSVNVKIEITLDNATSQQKLKFSEIQSNRIYITDIYALIA